MGWRHGLTTHTDVPQALLELLDGKNGRDLVRVNHFRPEQAREKRPRSIYAVRHANGAHIAMPNNDLASVHHALSERVNYVKEGGYFVTPPRPEESPDMLAVGMLLGRRAQLMCAAMRFLDRTSCFRELLDAEISKYDKESPLESMKYVDTCGGSRRKRYEAADQSLKASPFEPRDARITVFTKDEYQAVDGKVRTKPPRAIQTRSFRYHLALACYLHPIEKKVYECINQVFDPSGRHQTVAKGMNMQRRGEVIHKMWSSYPNPVAIGLDAARWDQHQHEHLLRAEHRTYNALSIGQSDEDHIPDLQVLLQHQLINHGQYKGPEGTIEYITRGKRASGDINTSLGNIHNMCMLMFSYLASKGLIGKSHLLNDGDDCVLIMDVSSLREFTSGLERWFYNMGVTMVVEGIFWQIEEIEFCQSHPVQVGGDWMLVPNPHKRLYSDLVTTKDLSSRKIFNRWVGAVAGCGLATTSGVPMLQSFYQWMGRGVHTWVPEEGNYYYRYRDELVKGMNSKISKVDWKTRISFFNAYGITPAAQVVVEKHFDKLKGPEYDSPTPLISILDNVLHLVEPKWADRID